MFGFSFFIFTMFLSIFNGVGLLSQRLKNISESGTAKVFARAKELKAKGVEIVDLIVGEPDFNTPENIKSSAVDAINTNRTKYTVTSGMVDLRRAIQKKLLNENNLKYELDEIIVSNGAKQSVFNSILAIVEYGDEVIIPAPYWVSYPEIVKLAGGSPVILETTLEQDFKVDISQLKKTITNRTKAFILCNPSNPTGSFYSKDELTELTQTLLDNKITLITDEIYEKLLYDDASFTSAASLSDQSKENTILINGVSKSYAMTGWRIGYAAASRKVISAMNIIQSHSTSCASSISQAAALEALTGDQSEIDKMVDVYQSRRDLVYNGIADIDGLKCTKPKGAFYIFPEVKSYFNGSQKNFRINNSIDLALYLLEEYQLAIVPGSSFGAEGYIRISFSQKAEILKEGIAKLKSALEKLK